MLPDSFLVSLLLLLITAPQTMKGASATLRELLRDRASRNRRSCLWSPPLLVESRCCTISTLEGITITVHGEQTPYSATDNSTSISGSKCNATNRVRANQSVSICGSFAERRIRRAFGATRSRRAAKTAIGAATTAAEISSLKGRGGEGWGCSWSLCY